jgi:formylglycine-generating enzyme required for sulfatase activity
MTEARRLRVFISSPSDVRSERLIAERVVLRLDREFSYHLRVEPVLWEREPLVASHHFQEKITPPRETDIVVVLLWARLGTPLPTEKFLGPLSGKAVTGTEWEFEDALKSSRERKLPELLMYRKKNAGALLDDDKAAVLEHFEQKERVESFVRTWFLDSGGQSFAAAFREFTDPTTFEELLESNLRDLLRKHLDQPDEQSLNGGIRWHDGSPFLGLRSFDLVHSPVFFGRTRARNELRELLARQSERGCAFILLVGASGSGKSSLVKAGLLADLLLPGMVGRVALVRYAVMRPGNGGGELLRRLAASLLSATALPELASPPLSETIDTLTALLAEAPAQVVRPIRQGLTVAGQTAQLTDRGQSRVLLVIDQLEELFTHDAITSDQREAFVCALAALARCGMVWVVATLRSDFFDHLESIPQLLTLSAGEARYVLAPPVPAEIARIIRQPAREAGVRFEVDDARGLSLDEIIVQAAARDPGALPSLSFLLDQLWQRRSEQGVLTFEAYRDLGELEGAIGRRAEQIYLAQPREVQQELGALLRELVKVGADGKVTSRTTPLSRFAQTGPRRLLLEAFLDPQARLLTADSDVSGSQVRVAHEALLTHWPRAQGQLTKEADDLELRGRLEEAARRWQMAATKARRSLLLTRGLPLQEALDLQRRWGEQLTPSIVTFVRASVRRVRWQWIRLALLVLGGIVALNLFSLLVGAGVQLMAVRSVEEQLSPNFQLVPAGCFEMGSPDTEPDRFSTEGPAHAVCVRAFELGRVPITQLQWKQVVDTPLIGVTGLLHEAPSQNKGQNLPVEMISWQDAQTFVDILNVFGRHHYRLPSEAEYEYAARAGSRASRYWGDNIEAACGFENIADLTLKDANIKDYGSYANCRDGYATEAPVGSFPANPFNLRDMLGNVLSWTQDCYNPNYKGAPSDGSAWESGRCELRMIRGGSYSDDPRGLRFARRYAVSVNTLNPNVGIRLVRTAP